MQENFAEKNFSEESFKEIDEKIEQAKNGDGQSAVALEQALLIVRSSSMGKQRKPEQIERLKDLILDYNRGALDYENID